MYYKKKNKTELTALCESKNIEVLEEDSVKDLIEKLEKYDENNLGEDSEEEKKVKIYDTKSKSIIDVNETLVKENNSEQKQEFVTVRIRKSGLFYYTPTETHMMVENEVMRVTKDFELNLKLRGFI